MPPEDPGRAARRFLFSSTAGYGHFHPLVPVAQALQRAGHSVAFAGRPGLRAGVEAVGFPFYAVGGNLAVDPEYQAVKARMHAAPLSLEAELYSYPRTFGGISARLRTGDLIAIVRAWGPDVVVREAGEYAALVAAEHLRLPHATVAFAAALRGMACFEQELAAQLDPVRARWDLPPDSALVAPTRYLHLAFAPPAFALQPLDQPCGSAPVPPTTHFIRPDVFDQAAGETLPAWIADLPDRPTIYATLGTEVNREPELYPSVMQAIVAGLRDLPINLIVTLGRGKDPADIGPQPAHVHIAPYIPQSLLLSRCDLMVMHAGSNSLLAAVDAGLPLVLVPLIADQFFNAEVAARLGLARVVSRGDLTPARVRAATGAVLAGPSYRRNVATLRAQMHALPGLDHAVTLLERLAAKRAPVLNPALPETG